MIAAIRERIDPAVRDDRGVTLVELIVTMGIFAIFLALLTAATTSMFGQMRKHQGIADNLDAGRKVVLRLDKQVRYSNNVNAPVTGADGNTYVVFRTGNKGQQQKCTQWRLNVAAKQLQYRSWEPILAGPGSSAASGWTIVASGVSAKPGTPVFSIAASAADATREQLTVAFRVTSGKPPTTAFTQVALTALNTTANTPTAGICGEFGTP